MDYFSVVNNYKLITEESSCENNQNKNIKVGNYQELENILISYEYDFIPEHIIIDTKGPYVTEEALATPDSLTLVSDSKKINYNKTIFMIKWFCNSNADIEVVDDKKYCKSCYEKYTGRPPLEKIKEILNSDDKTIGLSTSKKIHYLLLENKGQKLSAAEIYNLGIPWAATGNTPRNTVYARASSLYQDGLINKEENKYYV